MYNQPKETEAPLTFTLAQIASWKIKGLAGLDPSQTVSIPALQRGLVWEPRKNELLWDSILRGFPIGAVVVTPWSDRLKKRLSEDLESDYHLLDGQQRCNAIALGFEDPFVPCIKSEDVNTILWLDLQPNTGLVSTRNFWIRATTTAHPWGYKQDDQASRLNAGQIRDFLLSQSLKIDPSNRDCMRPSILNLWPADASARTPVPLGWLLRLASIEDESEFWSRLAERADREPSRPWALKVAEFCRSKDFGDQMQFVYKAVRGTIRTRVVALEAPENLMETSQREKIEGNREDVSNIEQLFQRLNTLGTQLDGEELAYSMIKAYWPELEEKINEASNRRMPPARMVSLAVRAALVKPGDDRFSAHPTVSRIRSIAKSGDGKEIVEGYIKSELYHACNRVNEWLEYGTGSVNKKNGLLPVIISSIAINSREVYLLLLHLANQRLRAGTQDSDAWKNAMRALATILHWFAIDKPKAVNLVLEACMTEVSVNSIARGIVTAVEAGCIHPIPAPGEDDDPPAECDVSGNHSGMTLSEFITLSSDEDLSKWSWDKLIWKPNDEAGNLLRQRRWQGILGVRWNREMLIHAQRAFMAERFEDYDPQRKDLWQDHDRPWDFDHILAHKFFYNRRQSNRGPFIDLIGQWGHTIANLRAWPSADNRSDQWDKTSEKIGDSSKTIEDSFMIPDEVQSFDWKNNLFDDCNVARDIVRAWRVRLLRIYREWYESVDIGKLLPLDR
jgi:hypothetical protein